MPLRPHTKVINQNLVENQGDLTVCSKTCLQETPQYTRESVPTWQVSLCHRFFSMARLGNLSEKMSPDQKVSSNHSVPCRQVLLYISVANVILTSCSQYWLWQRFVKDTNRRMRTKPFGHELLPYVCSMILYTSKRSIWFAVRLRFVARLWQWLPLISDVTWTLGSLYVWLLGRGGESSVLGDTSLIQSHFIHSGI